MPKTGDAEQAMRRFGLGDEDVVAWHDSGLPEDAFTGWLTDRVARRPSGRRAREVYGAEDVHDFARGRSWTRSRLGPAITCWRWDAAATCCSAMP